MSKVVEIYKYGECPDCGDPIPDDAEFGEECLNCGHVWWDKTVLEYEIVIPMDADILDETAPYPDEVDLKIKAEDFIQTLMDNNDLRENITIKRR